MKKILALFLCVLLTVGLFACGGETESETSTSASTEATEAPTSALVETPADIETAPTEEVHDHLHINYKGLEKKSSRIAKNAIIIVLILICLSRARGKSSATSAEI